MTSGVRVTHTRTDVHLHLDVSPPELTAHADPERIHQVVANLIDNAVKHSLPRPRDRQGAARAYPESLDLEVLDEGPGSRSRSGTGSSSVSTGAGPRTARSGSDGGTGLGLAIALGRSICTAAGSVADPARMPDQGHSSGAASGKADAAFEPEPQDDG